MDITQQGVVTLIRSTINGEKLSLPEGFTPEAADELIRKQGLLPLVYQGAYLCGIDAHKKLLQDMGISYFS